MGQTLFHEGKRRNLASIEVLSRFQEGHSFIRIGVPERTINARIGKLVCAGGYGGDGKQNQEDGTPASRGRRCEMSEQAGPSRQNTTRFRSTTFLIFFWPNQDLTLLERSTISRSTW